MPFPDISPIAFALGPFVVRWYALAYLVGVFLGAWYAADLLRRETLWAGNRPPFPAPAIWDFAFWAVIGIVLGGRSGYVLFYNLPYYAAHPADIVAVWDGGMSFHGGLLGILIAMALFVLSRRRAAAQAANPPPPGDASPLAAADGRGSAVGAVLQSFDLLGCIGTIGIFLVRITNFINGELYGAPTDLPWAVVFPTDPEQLPRHPTQLYEAGLEGLLLFVVIFIGSRWLGWLKRPGLVGGIFGVGYAAGRILVEFWRLPDVQIGYLFGTGWITEGMLLSVPVFFAGAVLIAYAWARPRG